MEKKRVLFIDEDNASTSQMAEAIVNARMGGLWEAMSAGLHPASRVRPELGDVLAEIGIDSRGRTKSINAFRRQRIDLVIAFCDEPIEHCPEWLRTAPHMRVPIQSLAELETSACCSRAAFRHLRREITRHVPEALGIWTINQTHASGVAPTSLPS